MYNLKVELFPGVCRKYEIDDSLRIGRDKNNDVILDDTAVSSCHTLIRVQDHDIFAEDLNSSNGTIINDVLIQKRYLKEDDHILIGHTNMWIGRNKTSHKVIEVKQEVDIEKVMNSDNIKFKCMSSSREIELLISIIEKKLSIITSEYQSYIEAIKEATKNICTHAYKEEVKPFYCQINCERDFFVITLINEGCGFDYRNLLTQLFEDKIKDKKGIFSIIRNTDYIMFNSSGSEITLAKKTRQRTVRISSTRNKVADLIEHLDSVKSVETKSSNLSKKHIAIHYPLVISDKEKHILKFDISPQPINDISFKSEEITDIIETDYSKSVIRIVPFFPNCICSPPSRELDSASGFNSTQFVLVPIVTSKNIAGAVEIEHQGKVIHSTNFLYHSHKREGYTWIIVGLFLTCISLLLSPLSFMNVDIKFFGAGALLSSFLIHSFTRLKKITSEQRCLFEQIKL